ASPTQGPLPSKYSIGCTDRITHQVKIMTHFTLKECVPAFREARALLLKKPSHPKYQCRWTSLLLQGGKAYPPLICSRWFIDVKAQSCVRPNNLKGRRNYSIRTDQPFTIT